MPIESWTKYVCTFLPTGHLFFYDLTPPLTQPMNQCCSLARGGREIRLQHCIFLFRGGGGWGRGIWQHACSCQANSHCTGFFTVSDPVKNILFTGFEIFYPVTRNIVCTEDCCNVNKWQWTCKGQNFFVINIIVGASHLFPLCRYYIVLQWFNFNNKNFKLNLMIKLIVQYICTLERQLGCTPG